MEFTCTTFSRREWHSTACVHCVVDSELRFALGLLRACFCLVWICFWDCACDGNDCEKWGYWKRHFRSHSPDHYLTTTTITTKLLFIRPLFPTLRLVLCPFCSPFSTKTSASTRQVDMLRKGTNGTKWWKKNTRTHTA